MKIKLPKGWEWKKLGEISVVSSGNSALQDNIYYIDGTYDFVRTSDVGRIRFGKIFSSNDRLNEAGFKKMRLFRKGTILFPKSGASVLLDHRVILGKDACVSSHLATIKTINKFCEDYYLFYFLATISAKDLIAEMSYPSLRTSTIQNINVPTPPLSEQKKIVLLLDKTLEKLGQAIALIEENIQKLKQLNESVLDEVFGGEKFPKVKIKNVVQKAGQFNPQNNPETEYTYIDISAIDKDIQKITNPNSFVGENAPSRAKKHIQIGDIVFATTRPNLKNIALVENEYLNPVASTGFCVLRVNEKIETKFLFHFLTSQIIQEQIAPLIRGAQYPAISDNNLLGCEIPLPSIPEQQSIVKYLDQTTEKNQKLTQHYQNKLEALKRLKNSVLDSAFKGELRRAKVTSISQPVIDPYFARTKKFNAKKNADKQAMVIALAIEVHEKVGKSLYRTKGEKTVEVLEKHLNIDFGREAEKMTAGPADFKHLVNVVEPLAIEKKWFYTQEIKGENYDGHKYIKAENFNPFLMRCVQDLKQNLDEIRRIVNLFAGMKTTRIAEVVATTYTGWNNLIIRNVKIDNETIVTEARENWHEAKLKIDRKEFFDAIEWLKNNNLVPQGNGKEVK